MLKRILTGLQSYDIVDEQLNHPESAVLLPIILSPEPQLILVKRSEQLNKHAGQIAFPGGKRESQDHSLIETALRETQEEIALSREYINIHGELNRRITRYGLQVLPVIASVDNTFDLSLLTPDASEIDNILIISFADLINPKYQTQHIVKFQQTKFSFPAITIENQTIWGLTHFILTDFFTNILNEKLPDPSPQIILPQ